MENFSCKYLNFSPPCGTPEASSPSYSGTHQAISDEETVINTIETSPPKRRAGRTKFRETRHPIYKGVRERNGGRWVCEMREPSKKSRIWLGTYPTPEMAARAHDVAAMALRGRSACLNFADSAWLLPLPTSASVEDIQKAAAMAAEAFRPSSMKSRVDVKSTTDEEDPKTESRAVTSSTPRNVMFYMDEEAVFDMPGLLASMAEGLLLSPPQFVHMDDVEAAGAANMSLWSYSF